MFGKKLNSSSIAIAHTFCASHDTEVSCWWCLLIQGYFCAVKNYAEKAELSKCSWYRKRKLGVATHFSFTIKLPFEKERAIHFFVFCEFKAWKKFRLERNQNQWSLIPVQGVINVMNGPFSISSNLAWKRGLEEKDKGKWMRSKYFFTFIPTCLYCFLFSLPDYQAEYLIFRKWSIA